MKKRHAIAKRRRGHNEITDDFSLDRSQPQPAEKSGDLLFRLSLEFNFFHEPIRYNNSTGEISGRVSKEFSFSSLSVVFTFVVAGDAYCIPLRQIIVERK